METPSQILSKLALGNVLPLSNLDSESLRIKQKKLNEKASPALSILNEAVKLDGLSRYPSKFDYSVYLNLEKRFSSSPIRGGITFGKPIRLVNHHATCQQCLYSFEIDTYGRGCAFNCGYCYAKAQLTVHGYWNSPIPVPMDLNDIRKTFYTVFETDRKHKYRDIFEKRIPLRIGSMSDSFMPMDKKFRVTLELLRILRFYNYPYIIFTRSDLVSHDEYMELFDPNLTSVQMSISSINDEMNKKLEPGAPSSTRRLLAVQRLTKTGIWCTVRLNPLFPMFPDGYFSDPNFSWEGEVPKFEFSSFDMVKKFSEYQVPSMLVGFARLSSFALNNIKKSLNVDLRPFYRRDLTYKSARDWHYTDAEVSHYYRSFKNECDKYGIEFTTCYIGNGESHFWKHQDMWSNKKDCCNAKGRVAGFKTDCRQISFSDRVRLSNDKCSQITSTRLHETLGQNTPQLVTRTIPAIEPSPRP